VRLSFRSGGVRPQRSCHLAGAMKHDTGLTRPLFGMQKPEMQPSLPWECLSKSEWNVARSSSKLNQFTPVNSTFPDGGSMYPPISVVVPPLCGGFMWVTRDSALWNRASALSTSRELRRQEFYKFKLSHPLLNTNKTVDSHLSTPYSCESISLFTNTFCTSLTTAKVNHKHLRAFVSLS
jgi:hypothetical protein